MGLLDAVLGAALSGASAGPGPQAGALQPDVASVLAQMLGNDGAHGGLGGLVQQFERAGLGDLIASWIGGGKNLPVSASQLQEALGPQLSTLSGPLLAMLPQLLPQIIDKLTPHGQAPQGGLGNADQILGALLHPGHR